MTRTLTSRTLPAAAAATLSVLALAAGPAVADGGHDVLRADLVGSMPAPASPQVAGINPGGAPWVNGPSEVRVREDGRVDVRIRGLVIPPPRGTNTNPIASVVVTLVCDGMVATSTAPFALSTAGDGRTRQWVMVPKHCEDAVALVQPDANRAVYIASGMAEDDD
ncbi:hypothetical protein [Phycicoccus avicenniae]|uniref:hypothetical protein n=1 Tax=Phycicoccus avicenniae TaxID=2828860 RepID=UPI003D288B56